MGVEREGMMTAIPTNIQLKLDGAIAVKGNLLTVTMTSRGERSMTRAYNVIAEAVARATRRQKVDIVVRC